jgi:hypothetical protein
MGHFTTFKFPYNGAISIPLGNTKLQGIPNTSFPPVVTCPPKIPCIKNCYASRYTKQYPKVREAYKRNLQIYKETPGLYWEMLDYFLSVKIPRLFRYLVCGDIPNENYLYHMYDLARDFKDIFFTCYTKRYDWIADSFAISSKPKNLNILVSAWPGFKVPKILLENYRIAWVDFNDEKRHLSRGEIKECSGSCEVCGSCYDNKDSRDVLLYKH